MLSNVAFNTPQGQSLNAASVCVMTANRYDNSEESITRTYTNVDAPQTNEFSQSTIRVQFAYWIDADAVGTHFPAILLNMVNGTDSFTIDSQELSQAKYLGRTLEEVCELYFTDVILPALQPAE